MSCDPQDRCITCGDTAVEMRVVRVDAERGLAVCADESGERCTVETALVQPVDEGDALLVHAGTALGHVTPPPHADLGAPGREAEEVPS